MNGQFPEDWDPFSRSYLTRAARRLDATIPCIPCDTEDYLQDLRLNLWRRRPRFNSRKGRWTTFVRLVTDNRAVELRERCLSGQCKAKIATTPLTPDSEFQNHGTQHNDESLILVMAVQECLRKLDTEEQQLCRSLMRNTVSELARELDVPRSTAVDRIRRLRSRFEQEGLKDFLSSS